MSITKKTTIAFLYALSASTLLLSAIGSWYLMESGWNLQKCKINRQISNANCNINNRTVICYNELIKLTVVDDTCDPITLFNGYFIDTPTTYNLDNIFPNDAFATGDIFDCLTYKGENYDCYNVKVKTNSALIINRLKLIFYISAGVTGLFTIFIFLSQFFTKKYNRINESG